MKRLHQAILIISALLGSWLGMQAVHESGHVLGALLSGGRVAKVVLHPLTISRTDLTSNPSPLLVVWAGPLFGIVLPLTLWSISVLLRLPCTFVLRFFAGFCLIANGAYIGCGSFDRVGDCGEMLRHGSTLWQLWLFGAVTVPAGLWLWQGQGLYFDTRARGGPGAASAARVAYASMAACLLLLALALVVGGE